MSLSFGNTDDNIVGYEIRYGSSWTQGLELFLVNATAKTLVGVKPGTHILWIAAKDALGNYSDTPVSITFIVLMPPSYSELASTTADFSTGSHSNTERYNDSVYGFRIPR